jgi:hypothetical protein
MNKQRLYFFCAFVLSAAFFMPGFIAAASGADGETGGALTAKVKIKLSVAAEAFNCDAKEKKALEKKIESYLMASILKKSDAAFADKNCDADISVRFKVAAAFSKNEQDHLCVMSVAAMAASSYKISGGGPALSMHEVLCLRMGDLNKNCDLIASMVNEIILAAVKNAKEIKDWKAKKYQQWKSNKSMSILDEELEAAQITFEQLLKEFKEMDGR